MCVEMEWKLFLDCPICHEPTLLRKAQIDEGRYFGSCLNKECGEELILIRTPRTQTYIVYEMVEVGKSTVADI